MKKTKRSVLYLFMKNLLIKKKNLRKKPISVIMRKLENFFYVEK